MKKNTIKKILLGSCALALGATVATVATSCNVEYVGNNSINVTWNGGSNTQLTFNQQNVAEGTISEAFQIKVYVPKTMKFDVNYFSLMPIGHETKYMGLENIEVNAVIDNHDWMVAENDQSAYANFNIEYQFTKTAEFDVHKTWNHAWAFCASYATYSMTNLFGPLFLYVQL